VQLLFEQQRVCTEVDIFLARDKPIDDLVDLRMHQRLTAGDGHHWRTALIHRFETFFRAKFFLQNVRGVLDLAAAGAREVAAEEGLEHQHKWITLPARKLLLQQVSGDCPAL
jgi:hypothetical protein